MTGFQYQRREDTQHLRIGARPGQNIVLQQGVTHLDGRPVADQPEQQAKLQARLGRTYVSLGLYQDAVSLLEQARDYHLATLGPSDPARPSAAG